MKIQVTVLVVLAFVAAFSNAFVNLDAAQKVLLWSACSAVFIGTALVSLYALLDMMGVEVHANKNRKRK